MWCSVSRGNKTHLHSNLYHSCKRTAEPDLAGTARNSRSSSKARVQRTWWMAISVVLRRCCYNHRGFHLKSPLSCFSCYLLNGRFHSGVSLSFKLLFFQLSGTMRRLQNTAKTTGRLKKAWTEPSDFWNSPRKETTTRSWESRGRTLHQAESNADVSHR